MARVTDKDLDRKLRTLQQETGLPLEFGSASGYTWINVRKEGGGTERFSEDYKKNADLLTWMDAYLQGWRNSRALYS